LADLKGKLQVREDEIEGMTGEIKEMVLVIVAFVIVRREWNREGREKKAQPCVAVHGSCENRASVWGSEEQRRKSG
jgi:hypothetical protein